MYGLYTKVCRPEYGKCVPMKTREIRMRYIKVSGIVIDNIGANEGKRERRYESIK